MNAPRSSRTATRLAIRHYVRQIWLLRRFSIPAILTIGIGSVFVTYLPPLVVAATINHFQGTVPELSALVPYLFWFGGVWMAGELLWRVGFLFLIAFETRAIGNLYIAGLKELNKKDIGFFHDNFAGSLTKKTLSYGKSFETFFDTLVFNVTAHILPLIFVGVVLWQFSPWLVVVLFSMLSFVAVLLVPLIKRRKRLVDAREVASNKMAGHVADVIGNMDAVQAFAHGDYEQHRHELNAGDYIRKARKSWNFHTLKIDTTISPIYVLINVIGLAVAVMLSNDTATLTAIFITFSYYASATRILWEFNRTYRNLESTTAEAAQFTELLLAPPAIQEVDNAQPLRVSKGTVSFRNVDFGYGTKSGERLFKNLNLEIAAGEKLALVGHSGGGKTTITKLLLRFVDISGGELLIDGQSIAQSRLADVREAIAYVPQDPVMFHRSIRDNIRYGKLDATDAMVEAAAKKANAHDFILKLPEGYETLVGERGVKLSGGQRQRIAIARAVIKDAPILVLDEATSALDSESEKLIQAALWELMKDRTAIVIAHRLSTIQKMDRIVVLENGSIVEAGSHQALLQHHGVYATLWKHQSGGFIEE